MSRLKVVVTGQRGGVESGQGSSMWEYYAIVGGTRGEMHKDRNFKKLNSFIYVDVLLRYGVRDVQPQCTCGGPQDNLWELVLTSFPRN